MQKLDEISSLVCLWQKLPMGQAKDNIFEQVHEKVGGSIRKETPYLAWITGQQEDWQQEAAIALVKAMERFEPYSMEEIPTQQKFITYFYCNLKAAKNSFYKGGRVVVQAYLNEKYKEKILDIRTIYVDGIEHANDFWGKLASIDNKREIRNIEDRTDLQKLMPQLKPVEIQALIHLMEGSTFKETAVLMGISHERVRQHLSNIIRTARGEKRNNATARLDVRPK